MNEHAHDVPVDEAVAIVVGHARPVGSERVAIPDALGRVLAEDVVSRREHPPWNNSAMDGYAVRWEDVARATPDAPVGLKVVGEVRAGGMATTRVGRGEAIEIMTGAPIPDGADSVVRVEDIERQGDVVRILTPCRKEGNVRLRGEDIHQGETVVPAGTWVRPAEVGMLATAAQVWAQVARRPQVTVLTTGDELAEPGDEPGPGQIVNSNLYSVTAQVREAGAVPVFLPPARDTREDLEDKLRQALGADIAIVIGGVSVGKYDFVKDVLAGLGCDVKFWRVRMRPGHPVVFGILPGAGHGGQPRLLFGLPGNPVACMVAFYQFVRPAIRKMLGLEDLFLPVVDAVLDEDVSFRPGRRHFARAITHFHAGAYHTRLTGAQGSGILTSMAEANSFLVIPEEQGSISAGNRVTVQLLPSP